MAKKYIIRVRRADGTVEQIVAARGTALQVGPNDRLEMLPTDDQGRPLAGVGAQDFLDGNDYIRELPLGRFEIVIDTDNSLRDFSNLYFPPATLRLLGLTPNLLAVSALPPADTLTAPTAAPAEIVPIVVSPPSSRQSPPVAAPDAARTDEDTTLRVPRATLLANDSDADGDPLTLIGVTAASQAGATVRIEGDVLVYDPGPRFQSLARGQTAQDAFSYAISDGRGGTATAQVVVTIEGVNDAPEGADRSFTIDSNTALALGVADFGFTDIDNGDRLEAVRIVVAPQAGELRVGGAAIGSGAVVLRADLEAGRVTFVPAIDGRGEPYAVFTFAVNDGAAADPTPNTITINVDARPVARDDAYATIEDVALTIVAPGVLGNDSGLGDGIAALTVQVGPAQGTIALGADGAFVYTPRADFVGTDSFVYRVVDSDGDAATAVVTVVVATVDDQPLARPDSYTTAEEQSLTVALPGVLGNDSGLGDGVLELVTTQGPQRGTLILNADGSFVYTPDADFFGTDGFTYRVADADGDSTSASVGLTVNPVNDAPVADGNVINANEEQSGVSLGLGAPTDPDNTSFSFTVSGLPSIGVVRLTAGGAAVTNGQSLTLAQLQGLVYDAPAELAAATTTEFTYSVSDGAASDSGTVTINVNPVNDAPALDLDGSNAGTGFSTSFAGSAVAIASANTQIADADSGDQIGRATLTLTNASNTGEEKLNIDTVALGVLGITLDASSTDTTLVLTGNASRAAYESAIELVTYTNTAASPTPGTRTIEVVVRDLANAASNTAQATVSVAGGGGNSPPAGADNTVVPKLRD